MLPLFINSKTMMKLICLNSFRLISAFHRALNQSRPNAASANANGLSCAVDDCFHTLEVRQPPRFSLDVRMRNLVTGLWTFFTKLTKTCHGLILPLRGLP